MQNAFFADYFPLLARTLLIPLTEPYAVFIASLEGEGRITKFAPSTCLLLCV